MSKPASCCWSASPRVAGSTLAAALLWAALLPAPPARAALIRVPATFPSVDTALVMAQAGDTVLVSPGTWPCSAEMRTGVTLAGQGGAGSVILDAQGRGAVIRLTDANGATVLQDLTLTGGTGVSSSGTSYGGGIHGLRSSPVLSRVRITACTAQVGGGAYFELGAPSLRACLLDGNHAEFGAGLATNRAAARLDTCELHGNAATGAGGGLLALNGSSCAVYLGQIAANTSDGEGAGAYFLNSAANLLNVTVQGNAAAGDGGGIYCGAGCSLAFDYDVFHSNHAARGGAMYLGCAGPSGRPLPAALTAASPASAGLVCSQVQVINNTLYANVATTAGSGLAFNDAVRATVLYNIVALGQGGYGMNCLDLRSSVDARCNDVWKNTPADWAPGCAPASNLSINPLFCVPEQLDFRLCENSPMAAAGCGISFVGAFPVECPPCRTAARVSTWGQLRRLYGPGASASPAPISR
ncbi:MAG: hypothetical protein HZB25_10220 [Candidatus Eisenbacteria bacterium]|nr:hypothetical protein [Candidatus Eisenbacteria bacterium]